MSDLVWLDPSRYQSIFQLAVALNIGLSAFKQMVMLHARKSKQRVRIVKDDFRKLSEAGCFHIENSTKDIRNKIDGANKFKGVVILTKSQIEYNIRKSESIASDAVIFIENTGILAIVTAIISIFALFASTFLDPQITHNPPPEMLPALAYGAYAMKLSIFLFSLFLYAPFFKALKGWIVPIIRISILLNELERTRDYLAEYIVDKLVEPKI